MSRGQAGEKKDRERREMGGRDWNSHDVQAIVQPLGALRALNVLGWCQMLLRGGIAT